ncbi:hypothetical protein KSX_90500 [Ktedonospora formicarum]|uniref:Uncharacterized protein n=1 Tax=Ktedonospora formicarum TaxID=2778364 RepID=A0A8J3IDR7_9CHLR|nr:hypothetical protein KSX_90500 [Ktedonospora formicarum]
MTHIGSIACILSQEALLPEASRHTEYVQEPLLLNEWMALHNQPNWLASPQHYLQATYFRLVD